MGYTMGPLTLSPVRIINWNGPWRVNKSLSLAPRLSSYPPGYHCAKFGFPSLPQKPGTASFNPHLASFLPGELIKASISPFKIAGNSMSYEWEGTVRSK